MSQPQRNINTRGGTYREIYNQGIYAEGDINFLQTIISSNRSEPEKTLLQQVGVEIANRLRQSLHNQEEVFINIEKEYLTKQVKRLWDYEVKVGSQANEKLSSDTTILEVFDRSDIRPLA